MESFRSVIYNYFNEIATLETTMPVSTEVFSALELENYKHFGDYLKRNCKIEDVVNGESFRYTVPEHELTRYQKYQSRLLELKTANTIIPRMYIVTLLCQYDAHVGNLISLVLHNTPSILNSSERILNFEQLSMFDTIEKAKEYLIDKEIESVLRCSHDDHISWFEKKLKINLRSDKGLLEHFFELTERRNIFTHNNGIVNDSYISNCKQHSCYDEKLVKGMTLGVDPLYFKDAVDTLIEIGVKVGHVIWRHLEKSDYNESELSINEIAYELIKREKYDLAIKLLEFALTCFKKISSAANELLLSINLSQCYLWKGDTDKSSEILNSQDWSLCTKDYLLAKYTLEGNFTEAIKIIENARESEIDKDDLIEWPIFKELRKTPEFKTCFEKIYGKTIEEVYKENSPEIKIASLSIED